MWYAAQTSMQVKPAKAIEVQGAAETGCNNVCFKRKVTLMTSDAGANYTADPSLFQAGGQLRLHQLMALVDCSAYTGLVSLGQGHFLPFALLCRIMGQRWTIVTRWLTAATAALLS